MKKYLFFTLVSAIVLIYQQIYLNNIINKYQKINADLSKKIVFGMLKHKEIVNNKDLEIQALKLNNSTYTVLASEKTYEDGYVEGYHKAINDNTCPAN